MQMPTNDYYEMIYSLCRENGISVINDEVNYWFVRSDGGSLFGEFRIGGYVGILWNRIDSLSEIKAENEKSLVDQFKVLYPDTTRPGNIFKYHDILLNQMKKGDIVLVPSENSQTFLVGYIDGDFDYARPLTVDYTDKGFDESKFVKKRRPVKWLTSAPVPRSEVDPILLSLVYSQHTIVSANQYSEFINRIIFKNRSYFRNGELHMVLGVSRTSAIPASLIAEIVTPIAEFCRNMNAELGIDFDENSLGFQATVNSPGMIEIIGYFGTPALIGIAVVTGVITLSVLLAGGKISISKYKSVETAGFLKSYAEFLDKMKDVKAKDLNIEKLKKSIEKLDAPKDESDDSTDS